jgi:hypothetical protein
MGCGSSKGSAEGNSVEEITFKVVGVHGMDEFFEKCKKILDDFKGLLDPVNEAKDKYLDATGFF